MDRRVNNHKSSIFNYDANTLSFLIYFVVMIANFIPFLNYFIFALPLIIYVMEKKSNFVRNHSLQAFVISLLSSIFSLFCLLISFISKPRCNSSLSFCFGSSIIHKMFSTFGSIRWMFAGFIFVICLVLALRAYNYENYKLEYIDKFIDKIGDFLNRLLKVIPINQDKKIEEVVQTYIKEPKKEKAEEIKKKKQKSEKKEEIERDISFKKEEIINKSPKIKRSSNKNKVTKKDLIKASSRETSKKNPKKKTNVKTKKV